MQRLADGLYVLDYSFKMLLGCLMSLFVVSLNRMRLQAAEEEVRQRAAVKRGGYTGPCIRFKTKQINGEGLVSPRLHFVLKLETKC